MYCLNSVKNIKSLLILLFAWVLLPICLSAQQQEVNNDTGKPLDLVVNPFFNHYKYGDELARNSFRAEDYSWWTSPLALSPYETTFDHAFFQ